RRWADPMEAQKAMDKIMSGKLVQITSVRDFIDDLVETCQNAGWLEPNLWREFVLKGLKKDVAMMAGPYFPLNWDDFRTHLILCDEQIQRQKVKESSNTTTKKTTTSSSSPSSSSSIQKKDVKPRTDNSKF